ncbi:MAG TPA: dihydrolipoyl dehydrogenase, partial [Candidatus Cloacimonetes bacterium]|nr:dihydrolipoyl dehydrogenase [Candidatus Cloacimonadota bacterium]
MKKYAVIVVGGGPGGYVSAIRLDQFKIDVAVFEKERLGGVCLNHGCIPTKSMVKVAELFAEINEADNFGIEVKNPKINYLSVFNRKNEIVDKLVSGIEFIFKKRNIPIYNENILQIEKRDNEYLIKTDKSEYSADHIILATG